MKMRAIGQDVFGGPEVLKVVEAERPTPGPGEVLVRVHAAGVNPTLLQSLLEFIHRLRDQWGKTFLIIEHNMRLIMGHCDKIVLMNAGRVIAEGASDEIQANAEVLEAYFGKKPAHRRGGAGS